MTWNSVINQNPLYLVPRWQSREKNTPFWLVCLEPFDPARCTRESKDGNLLALLRHLKDCNKSTQLLAWICGVVYLVIMGFSTASIMYTRSMDNLSPIIHDFTAQMTVTATTTSFIYCTLLTVSLIIVLYDGQYHLFQRYVIFGSRLFVKNWYKYSVSTVYIWANTSNLTESMNSFYIMSMIKVNPGLRISYLLSITLDRL